MGLFDKLKSLVSDDMKDRGSIEIVAPLSGNIVNIEDIPDVVFSKKIWTMESAIKPSGNTMASPRDGTISKFFETNHAFPSNLIAALSYLSISVSIPSS